MLNELTSYARSMGDPAEILAKLLGGPVKLYVTRCSLLELQGLGSDFSGTITQRALPNFSTAQEACIAELISVSPCT